jgi:hypothetical protein
MSLNLHFACPNTAQRHKGRELNSRPLDVDVLWLLSFKNTESEKKMILMRYVDLKGVSSTHVL